jgi:hypothetical protein
MGAVYDPPERRLLGGAAAQAPKAIGGKWMRCRHAAVQSNNGRL